MAVRSIFQLLAPAFSLNWKSVKCFFIDDIFGCRLSTVIGSTFCGSNAGSGPAMLNYPGYGNYLMYEVSMGNIEISFSSPWISWN